MKAEPNPSRGEPPHHTPPSGALSERRESDLLFRQLAENIREVFYIYDTNTHRLIYVSPSYRDVWGCDLDPGDADSPLHAVSPEHRGAVQHARDDMARGEATELTYSIMRPNGERRWILDRSFPVRDHQGHLLRAVGIAEDITDEKERAERQQFLADAATLLTGTLDYQEILQRLTRLAVPRFADWCVVYMANGNGDLDVTEVAHSDPGKIGLAHEYHAHFPPSAQDAGGVHAVFRTGKSEWYHEITDELIERTVTEPERLRTIRELGLRSAITVPLIARGVRLGVMAFISAESGHLYDEDDVAFAEDLAGRAAIAADNARLFQAAEAALRDAERREREEAALRRATEAVAATFSVHEVIETIAHSALDATAADGAFVERLQPDAQSVVVVATAGEMAPSVGETVMFDGSVAEYVLESGQPEVIRVLGQTRFPLPGTLSKTYADSSAVAVPLIDAGEAIGVLILLRAVTREPFTDSEIARAHTFGNLASLAFRKVHLLEAAEERSRELEQVMESRTRLVRGFSHDLKNPLGAADGHAALLEDGLLGELSGQQLASVTRIRAALKNAVALINDLVELARAESGQLAIKQQPLDVREIARELVEQYRPAAEQAGLSLKGHLEKVPIVTGDADRLRQVLGNLLSNAVKYTPEGGRVEVRTGQRQGADGQSWVVIDVVDSGIGIPQDKLGVLFKEFERIDPSVKPGAGLGLAISRRIARLLGGDVTVDTKRGHGSTFTLWVLDSENSLPK